MKSTKVTSYKLPLIILSCLLAITIGVLIAIWIPYSTGQRSEEKYESTGFAMGTYMQQTLLAAQRVTAPIQLLMQPKRCLICRVISLGEKPTRIFRI